MRTSLILLLITSSLSSFSLKNSGGSIRGFLSNAKNERTPFGTVLLKRGADSSLVKGELANDAGEFNFESVPPGTYYLEIRCHGHKTKRTAAISIEQNSLIDLGPVIVEEIDITLQGVMVTAEKPFIERQADRTVVNVENSIIHSGGSVLDVMEKLPAVQVNQDGRVSLKGKPSVVIMLDGKPMAVAGQDLSNMLRSMSSSGVQKIEIITNPSAKFDAAGNAGIINIITRKNQRDGFNGSANANYAQGRYEKYNGGFNTGYKNQRLNAFCSYNYAHRKGFNNLILTRNFYRNDSLNTTFETANYIIFPFNTHTFRGGSDLFLSRKTTVSVLASGMINDFRPSADNYTAIFDGQRNKTGSYLFKNRSDDHFRNHAFNSQLKHQFDSSGTELTVDLDYARYWNFTDQVFTTSVFDDSGTFTGDRIMLGNQDGDLSIYSAKTDFSKDLGKKLKLEAGGKSSYVEMESDIRFFNRKNDQDVFDSTQSNHFLYDENINAGYLNLSGESGKFRLQFGLRGEQTIANGHQLITGERFRRRYFQFFPSAFIDFRMNKRHAFNLSLSRRIDRPAYQQMNPFRKLIDATTFATGNPMLLPQLTYNSEFTWSFLNSLFVTLGYSYTSDNITDVLVQDAEKRVTVQTVLNLQEYHAYSANIVFSKKLTEWWTTNTSLFSFYGQFIGTVNSYSLNQGYPSFTFNASNSFSMVKGLSAELSLIYNHRSLYGVTLMNPNYNLSLGIKKNILNNRGSLVLNCSDVFWKAWPSGYTDFGNVNESWQAVRDTRQVSFAFSYRFGKGQVKMRRNSGADSEKSRAGGQ